MPPKGTVKRNDRRGSRDRQLGNQTNQSNLNQTNQSNLTNQSNVPQDNSVTVTDKTSFAGEATPP